MNAQNSEYVFVVECCQNCSEHRWNTRHNEEKYQEFFKKIASEIIARIPNATVMKNQIPKNYIHHDLYNNLVPDDDDTTHYYQQVPRTGAFEVSYKGMLVFSKLKGGYWPNCELVADKCYHTLSDDANGKDTTQYLAGQSPVKGGGFGTSTKKRSPKKSSSKIQNTNQSQMQPPQGVPFQHQQADVNLREPAEQFEEAP